MGSPLPPRRWWDGRWGRDRAAFRAAVRVSTLWAVLVAVLVSAVYFVAGPWVVDALTTDPDTRAAARLYLPWAALAPLAGVLAFQLDGIFIGATRSAEMRNAMLFSTAVFVLAWWLMQPWGNHGLWAALYVNYVARTLSLGWYYPALARLD